MKKVTLVFLVFLLVLPIMLFSKQQGSKTGQAIWLTDFEQAKLLAQKNKVPILINFTGSDWCIWCKKLSGEVFEKKEFNDYAKKNLVLLKIDFPRAIKQTDAVKKSNQALAQKYKIEGYPTLVLTDASGKELNRASYQAGGAAKYVTYLKGLLANPVK